MQEGSATVEANRLKLLPQVLVALMVEVLVEANRLKLAPKVRMSPGKLPLEGAHSRSRSMLLVRAAFTLLCA